MPYHQKKDGRHCVYYLDPVTKKRKWEYFGRGLTAEKRARDRDAELKEKFNTRPWVRRTRKKLSPLFSELVNAYTESRFGNMENSTLERFLMKMKGVILPELGQTPAAMITPRRLNQYTVKRLKTSRMTKGVHSRPFLTSDGIPAFIKRTTVHRELSDIQAVLNWAAAEKYITHNPAAGYKKPKRDDEIIPPPSLDEISRIFTHAADHLKRALITAYYTGIRPGRSEMLQLKWVDIDFGAWTLFVRSAKKNGIPSRSIPLHVDFLELLKTWQAADQKNGNPDYIIHYRGRPVKKIIKGFYSAKKKAGIARRLRPYDFRHAFATAALKAGGDLKATSELLGHTRIETTAQIYQHVDTELKRSVIKKLPALNIEQPKTED